MENKIVSYKLTDTPIKYGFMNVLKNAQDYFPGNKTDPRAKISAAFDDSTEEVELTYSPKWGQLYGLTGWYKAHSAKVGDIIKITVLVPKKKFRFEFQKGVKGRMIEQIKTSGKSGRGESIVGELINFRGLVYAPINEQGVIFIFSKIIEDLKMYIEEIKTGFPDAICRRFNGQGWVRENIEFELRSSNFLQHGHDSKKCDIIVCWEDDWKACPIEVIELKSLIKQLPNTKEIK